MDHLHSLTTCHRAAAVAVAELNPQRAREATVRHNVPRSYTDYHELLEQPDIDAVIIALPNHLHAPVTLEALKARKHVLVEKPMATNAKDAAKMIEAAKLMKRTLMVAQNFRFNRYTQLAKQIIDRGDLGELYHIRCFWLRRAGIPRIGSWFTQKKQAGGGCIYDLGVHLLDTCLHLLKEFDVTTVSAQTYAKFGPRGLGETDWGRGEVDPKRPFDVEDYGVALLRMKSGRSISMEVGWACFQNQQAREYGIDLFGTAAGFSLFPAKMFKNTVDAQETIQYNASKVPFPEDRVHHFVQCVLEGKKMLVPPEESLKVQQVLDALYASAASGKEVRLA